MGEACIPFGYVRGISPVPLMLMVKIESYAIGSAFGRGQARGRRLYADNSNTVVNSETEKAAVLRQYSSIFLLNEE